MQNLRVRQVYHQRRVKNELKIYYRHYRAGSIYGSSRFLKNESRKLRIQWFGEKACRQSTSRPGNVKPSCGMAELPRGKLRVLIVISPENYPCFMSEKVHRAKKQFLSLILAPFLILHLNEQHKLSLMKGLLHPLPPVD